MIKNTLSTISKENLLFALIAALFVVGAFISLNNLFVYTPDSARYVAWANSLAQFKGFTDYTEPEAIRYCVHSPLYSLFLAPIAFFSPGNIIGMKIINIIFGVGVASVLFILLKKRTSAIAAILGTFFFFTNPWVLFLSTQLLTEMLFGLGFVLLLYVLHKELEPDPSPYNFYAVLLSLLVCVFSREIGIVLLPLVVGFYIIRKEYTKGIVVFFLPVFLYIVWYIRNEVYYAGIEQPPLRNSALLFAKTLVPDTADFTDELFERFVHNGSFYLRELSTLLFSPSYMIFPESKDTLWAALIDTQAPVIVLITAVLQYLYWIITAVSLGLVALGMVADYKNKIMFIFKVLFLVAYFIVLMIYPVFDGRFLFPILLLSLIWTAYGIHLLFERYSSIKGGMSAILVVMFLLSLPNFIWSMNFIAVQHRMIDDPQGLFIDNAHPGMNVRHTQLTLPEVAQWINEQHDSSAVVVAPYKELALYLHGRTVRVVNSASPLGLFNLIIRDNAVNYIVLLKDANRLRDYEYQMDMNDIYSFQLVDSAGCFEVYKVVPFERKEQYSGWEAIVNNMKEGRFDHNDKFFSMNHDAVMGNPKMVLLDIINKHFMGQLDSAELLMERLYRMPQGLSFTARATEQQNTIELRRLLDRNISESQRAQILFSLGVKYWNLGMKQLSLKYSRESLDADSTFALPYAYNIFFDIQSGDTLHAFSVLRRLKRAFPNTEFTAKLDSVMKIYKALSQASTGREKAIQLHNLFLLYSSLGLDDYAVGCGLQSLYFDPSQGPLYREIAAIYERHRIHSSALMIMKRYLRLNNNDDDAREFVQKIKDELYIADR